MERSDAFQDCASLLKMKGEAASRNRPSFFTAHLGVVVARISATARLRFVPRYLRMAAVLQKKVKEVTTSSSTVTCGELLQWTG
jgi:hypothetical protein